MVVPASRVQSKHQSVPDVCKVTPLEENVVVVAPVEVIQLIVGHVIVPAAPKLTPSIKSSPKLPDGGQLVIVNVGLLDAVGAQRCCEPLV